MRINTILGNTNKNNPNSTVIGGNSLPKERTGIDIKLSSRVAKSDVKRLRMRSNVIKPIGGSVTP